MSKKILLTILGSILIIPTLVCAKEYPVNTNLELLAQTTKYIRTETRLNTIPIGGIDIPRTQSSEVTEEEYNSAVGGISTRGDGMVETTYKKMVTSIYQNGQYYRYDNTLTWKNMPSVRSFDIIGIGKNPNVTFGDGPYFSQRYCTSSTNCYVSYTHTHKTGSTGAGATCQLMTGSLYSLKINILYDVTKNTNLTLYGLEAYGDYSHATTTVTNSQAQHYSVNSSGINLTSEIYSYYDDISPAVATWYGTW